MVENLPAIGSSFSPALQSDDGFVIIFTGWIIRLVGWIQVRFLCYAIVLRDCARTEAIRTCLARVGAEVRICAALLCAAGNESIRCW